MNRKSVRDHEKKKKEFIMLTTFRPFTTLLPMVDLVHKEGGEKCPPVDEYTFLDTQTYSYYSDLIECDTFDKSMPAFQVPDVTPGYFEEHVHYFTVATNWHPFLAVLLRSAGKMGRSPTVLGADDERFRKKYVGGVDSGMKIQHMRNTIKDLPDDDIVIFTDAYDVVFVRPIDEMVREYLKFGSDIVISGEKNCYPDKSRAPDYPLSDETGPYKYLNAGAYIGRVRAIKWLFSSHYWRLRESDQRFWTSLYLRHRGLGCGPTITIDSHSRLFQSMNADGPQKVPYSLGSFQNTETGTSAYLLHFAGPYKPYIIVYYLLTYYMELLAILVSLFALLYFVFRLLRALLCTSADRKAKNH